MTIESNIFRFEKQDENSMDVPQIAGKTMEINQEELDFQKIFNNSNKKTQNNNPKK